MARLRLLPLALVAAPSAAGATVFESFGAGARAEAMAGAVTATATDGAAVWHNPAGLSLSRDSIGLGLTGAFDRTAILLAPRPRGYDPPDYDLRLNPREDSGDQGQIFGVLLSLNLRLFSDDFHAGFLAYFPSVGFAHADGYLPDEREQYMSNRLRFERLDERLRTEVIAFAGSYRLADWLSLGAGLNMLQGSRTETQVYTPNAAVPGQVYMATDLEQTTDLALIAGAMVQPWDFLRFGLAFHDELAFEVRGRSVVQIRGQENEDDYPITQPIEQVQHASPPRFDFGVAYTGAAWTAAVDASWELWSRYLGPDGQLAGFEDGYSVRAGFEHAVRKGTRFRGGLGWHPSPVPDQTGRTNYVDNHRIVAALGAGSEFEWWEQRFEVDLGLQMHALLERETTKRIAAKAPGCATGTTRLCDEVADSDTDTPVLSAAETRGLQTGNPGFPGFSAGGYLVAGGVDVRWLF